MNHSPTYYDLLEACTRPGCPVCRLVQRGVQGYLKSLFYENVNDPETRLELRKTLGFCFDHAWLLLDAEIGDALGTSIIYHDVVGFVLKAMGRANEEFRTRRGVTARLGRLIHRWGGQGNRIGGVFQPSTICPVCAVRETTTRLVLEVVVQSMTDEAFCQGLEASQGLCLPHLGIAFERVQDSRGYENLLRISCSRLGALRQELAEFIRKNDYRFRDEKIGAEGAAWRRVVGIVVGEKGK